MEQSFKEPMQQALGALDNFNTECFVVTREFWLIVDRSMEELSESHLEELRDKYRSLEKLKKELDDQLYVLRQMVEVVVKRVGGPEKKVKDREREAWVNWVTFTSRSAMMGLQGLYARFLFDHQDELLTFPSSPMTERFVHYHELLKKQTSQSPRSGPNIFVKGL